MPYAVRRSGDKWQTYNPESGKVYGTHDSKGGAEAQLRALYVNAPPSEEEKGSTTKKSWWGNKRSP